MNKFLLICVFFIALFGALVEAFGMPTVLANETQCGIVNRSISLISNVSSNYTCFWITTSHATLDCQGNNLTHGTIGRSIEGVHGILSEHNINVTIKNCFINRGTTRDSTSNKDIKLNHTINNIVENNTILTLGASRGDIDLGILVESSRGALIRDNIVGSPGPGNPGIYLNNSYENQIVGNQLTSGDWSTPFPFWSGAVINLFNSSRNVFDSNVIVAEGFRLYGIKILNETGSRDFGGGGFRYPNDTAQDNIFVNNNITVSAGELAILDENHNINYLIYNNSFGEIKWIDNSTDGYLGNLSVFVRQQDNQTGFGLDRTFFIRNNSIAVNLTSLSEPNQNLKSKTKINSSAQLTFKGLAGGKYNQVRKFANFSTNTTEIQQNGDDCLGTTCTLLSYDKDNGVFVFNTTSLGSFAAMEVKPAFAIASPLDKMNTTNLRVLLNVSILTGDPSTGTIVYNINEEGNVTFCSSCSSMNTTLLLKNYGNQTIVLYANDTLGHTNKTTINFQIALDTDGDGIIDELDNDDDGDGVPDSNDVLVGGNTNINSNTNVNLILNGSANLTKEFAGLLELNFTNGTVPLVEFLYNFSVNQSLSLPRVHIITHNATDTVGSIIVRGLNMTENRKKTVYIDDKDAVRDSVCIKDAEINSINDITATCTGANEFKIRCDGTASAVGHTCTKIDGRYKITGLSNSGVVETINPPDPAPGGGGGGGGGGGSSTPSVEEEETPVSTPQLAASSPATTEKTAEEEAEAQETTEQPESSLITGAVVGVNNFRIPLQMSVVALVVVLLSGGYVLLHSSFIKKEEKVLGKFVKKQHGKILILLFILLLVATVVLANYSAKASQAICVAGKDITYYGSSVGCDGCAQQEDIIKNLQVTQVDCAENMKQCKADDVKVVPSFEIEGEFHKGILSVARISELSGC